MDLSEETKESMLSKWDYSGVDSVCYSDSKQESYIKSAEFLGNGQVEDWGCGTGWSKRFFSDYRGIDGSPHKNVDEIVDLITYTSKVDNILLRQVLELNREWKIILDNAKKSFSKKMCIVIFTPFAQDTIIGEVESALTSKDVDTGKDINLIYFNKQDILDCFPSTQYKVTEEIVETEQGYNQDWILYIEKITSKNN
jgi:hypothetical protein